MQQKRGLTIPHLIDEGLFSEPAAYTPDSNDLGIVIEHKGVVWVDLRYPASLCKDSDEAMSIVSKVLPEGCTLKLRLAASPLQTSAENPTASLFKKVAEEVIGKPIPFKKEHGGTDARYFSEKGIPAFLYGPKGAGLHGDNEWVSISSLEKHYEMYRELFKQLSL